MTIPSRETATNPSRGAAIVLLTLASIHETPSHPIRCGPFKVTRRGLARAAVLAAVHVIVILHIFHWRFFGRTISPVEPSEAATSIETGFINAGFILFTSLILLTLLFGRFFCGWACHVVAYQDLCSWILKKLKLKPRPVRSRLLALVPFYAAFEMFISPTLQKIWNGGAAAKFQDWAISTENLWERFPGPGIAILTIAVDGFLIVWWLGAKGFCNYGCPYGAIFNITDRFAPGRIRVTDACNGCGHCTAVCTSNVRVHEEVLLYKNVVDAGCMKCMDCVSSCPNDALYYGMGAPGILTKKPAARPKKHYDFSWPEEIGLLLLFTFALVVYRDLYNAVPFLLALGAASMFAFGCGGFVRMLRSADFTFQSFDLKRGGKFTKSGFAAAAVISIFVLFTIHSAAVQYYTKTGERYLLQAKRGGGAVARDASREQYQTAEKLGIFPNATLQLALASIAYNRGEATEAEKRLRASLQIEPRLVEAWISLAEIQLKQGPSPARATLELALEQNPGNAKIKEKLALLKGR